MLSSVCGRLALNQKPLMSIDSSRPLLRLNVSAPQQKQAGEPKFPKPPEQFSVDRQRSAFGLKFERLASVLQRDPTGIELRNDPTAMAPKRLLVFELRGSIQSFFSAA